MGGPATAVGSDLRDRMRRTREEIEPVRRYEASQAIEANLDRLPAFTQARAIGFYFTTGSEVQTGALIRRVVEDEGRRAFLPFLLNDRLEMTEWRPSDPVVEAPHVGMQPRFSRPAPIEELDAIVVTGLAFDRAGRRLGSGTGHHARLLARLPARVARIGIQFAELVVPAIDTEADPERVDHVVTEDEIVHCAAAGPASPGPEAPHH
jgi:5-formyltetrahydrofolate cyclo-ligase